MALLETISCLGLFFLWRYVYTWCNHCGTSLLIKWNSFYM